MPLTFCSKNKEYKIIRLQGNPNIKQHLSELGFIQGNTLKIINVIESGYIIQLLNSRIAIDQDLANKIYVSN